MTQQALVERMAAQMRAELAANAFKGDEWETAKPDDLRHELAYHVVKLLCCFGPEATTEYAADVANCAAILADRLGGLQKLQAGNLTDYTATPAPDYMRTLADNILELLP